MGKVAIEIITGHRLPQLGFRKIAQVIGREEMRFFKLGETNPRVFPQMPSKKRRAATRSTHDKSELGAMRIARAYIGERLHTDQYSWAVDHRYRGLHLISEPPEADPQLNSQCRLGEISRPLTDPNCDGRILYCNYRNRSDCSRSCEQAELGNLACRREGRS